MYKRRPDDTSRETIIDVADIKRISKRSTDIIIIIYIL